MGLVQSIRYVGESRRVWLSSSDGLDNSKLEALGVTDIAEEDRGFWATVPKSIVFEESNYNGNKLDRDWFIKGKKVVHQTGKLAAHDPYMYLHFVDDSGPTESATKEPVGIEVFSGKASESATETKKPVCSFGLLDAGTEDKNMRGVP